MNEEVDKLGVEMTEEEQIAAAIAASLSDLKSQQKELKELSSAMANEGR